MRESLLGVARLLVLIAGMMLLLDVSSPAQPTPANGTGQPAPPSASGAAAEAWVERTLASMSVAEQAGQLVVPSFESTFASVDSDEFDTLLELVRDHHVGGLHVFGGRRRVPRVRLNPTYGRVTLGDPHAAAATLNRLQRAARVPLLGTGDFEAGVGFRMDGATLFPRAMAFGAAGDERLAFEAGRITALEARAIGVHLNFAPVVDVNYNPRNPVINTRSFGEDPAAVGRLASAYVRGLHEGGMLATVKHYPGHGNTDVDTHLRLARIAHGRDRWERLEWTPFRMAIDAGADAVMTAHVTIQALETGAAGQPSADGVPRLDPASLSPAAIRGFLRGEAGFDGLVVTDSMSMQAVLDLMPPGDAAVRAVQAGNDIVLHSPDPVAAVQAIRAAVDAGTLDRASLEAAVRRVLRVKARAGLHRRREVELAAVAERLGRRDHLALATDVAERAITLVRDTRSSVPLTAPPEASIYYLSVLDYPGNWGIGAPSRRLIPELEARWPAVEAVEVSDATPAADLERVREEARDHDVVLAGVFVRTASGSGRMDLEPALAALLEQLAQDAAASGRPFVAVLFGNPYVATVLPSAPTLLLAYDYSEHSEAAAVRALAGEAPIGGRLPITLPGVAVAGAGIERAARDPDGILGVRAIDAARARRTRSIAAQRP